ncbi:MAG: O-antigen ligase family protein, partial [Rhizobacter sp.]|nr:O-antigen ligase family protein [Rhizobacter sp.]
MLINAKALAFVLVFATTIFVLAKPLCLRFMAPEDFARRRAVWFYLTIASFLLPNYWLFVLVAAPVIVWAGTKDSSPLALYLLLFFVTPPYEIPIPTVLIGQLFAMTPARVLDLLILVPAVCIHLGRAARGERLRLGVLDWALLAYGALQLALFVPYESGTNTLRRAFLFLLDTYLVYFAFTRLLASKRDFADALSALTLAVVIFAPIAIFESVRGWLLYTGVVEAWGYPNVFAWLFRGEALRAQAAAGHSIVLGCLCTLALGFWMYLRQYQTSKTTDIVFFALMFACLVVTYARGPWVSAVAVLAVAVMLGARNAIEMIKLTSVPALIAVAAIASPFGSRILEFLPFVGSGAQDTVGLREQLAETSWRLIQQNPWFGNPFVLLDMENLRTGDG